MLQHHMHADIEAVASCTAWGNKYTAADLGDLHPVVQVLEGHGHGLKG